MRTPNRLDGVRTRRLDGSHARGHFAFGAVLVAAALTVAACTSSGGGGTTAAKTSGASGGAKRGGALTIGTAVPLASFDPYNNTTQNFIIYNTLYSHLATYDDTFTPHPDLAESWQIAKDGKSVTIKLRDTVFDDGTPLTADDIIAGIKRAKDPATGLNQAAQASVIANATAVDTHTVRVNFVHPVSEDVVFDWMVAFPVVEASKNTIAQLKQDPAGTGPFVLDSYVPGDRLVLKRNPHYYDAPKPYIDNLTFRFFDSADALVAAVQSGGVDGGLHIDVKYLDQVKDKYNVVQGAPAALENMFYLNPLKPPFDNAKCRQAVARALDRKKIIDTVQGGLGAAIPGPFAPGSPAFDKSLLDTNGFDLDAAKAGIDSSCSSKSATAGVQPAPGVLPAMQIIQADLKQIGFDLKISTMDQTTFVTKFRNGDLQVAISATAQPYRSSAEVAGAGPLSIGKNNFLWSGKPPQEYVDAVSAAQAAVTPAEVTSANKAINSALVDQGWATGLFTRIDLFVLDKNVAGFTRNPADQAVFTDTYLAR